MLCSEAAFICVTHLSSHRIEYLNNEKGEKARKVQEDI